MPQINLRQIWILTGRDLTTKNESNLSFLIQSPFPRRFSGFNGKHVKAAGHCSLASTFYWESGISSSLDMKLSSGCLSKETNSVILSSIESMFI